MNQPDVVANGLRFIGGNKVVHIFDVRLYLGFEFATKV